MKKAGSLTLFEAAELLDTINSIRVLIIQIINACRPDIDVYDENSGYPIVKRVQKIRGDNISVAQAIKMKDYWRRHHYSKITLSDCELFCLKFRDVLK